MKLVDGKLEPFFETGTEGVIWSVYEDNKLGYEGLHPLEYGDYLRIYSDYKRDNILWQGNIYFDWETNWRPYPMNPKYGQQEVLGYWVHGIQKDLEPKVWGKWFFDQLPAQLVKSELGRFNPIKDKYIRAASYSGQVALFDSGKIGDLTLVFDDGLYAKFFSVDPQVYSDFLFSDKKYEFFLSRIKGKYKTERVLPFQPF